MAPTAASRGWDAAWLRRWLSDASRPPARASWTLVPDFRAALREVQRGAGTVLVTGSFHTVGDVMASWDSERSGRSVARSLASVAGVLLLRRVPMLCASLIFCPCNPRPCRDFAISIPPISRSGTTSSGPGGRSRPRYGFEEYDGPPLEPLELYTAKSGEEIVGQLYSFTDKGGREVSLRPEMTPTLASMVAARANGLKKPIRWFSIPQLFRYERQQRGRLREHFQLNCDLIGESGHLADAEIVALAIDVGARLRARSRRREGPALRSPPADGAARGAWR